MSIYGIITKNVLELCNYEAICFCDSNKVGKMIEGLTSNLEGRIEKTIKHVW